jgi:hypothetical protein
MSPLLFRKDGEELTYRPNLMIREGTSSAGSPRFADVLFVGVVKPTEEQDKNERLMSRLARYMWILRREQPTVAVCHGFTLCGHVLRLWRFDARTYSCALAIDLGRADHMPTFVKFIAFVTNPSEVLVRWTPLPAGTPFRIARTEDADAQSSSSAATVEDWEFVDEPQLLIVRNELFGGRTTCWAGKAKRLRPAIRAESGSPTAKAPDSDAPQYVVIKTTWVASYLVGHEATVLRHLAHHNVKNVPVLLGTLLLPELARVHTSSNALVREPEMMGEASDQIPEWSWHGIALDVVVMTCPVAKKVETSEMSARDMLLFFSRAAEILRDVALANVHYRDINSGNLLLVADSSGDDPQPLLIDFGNARIGDDPRGKRRAPLAPGRRRRSQCQSTLHVAALNKQCDYPQDPRRRGAGTGSRAKTARGGQDGRRTPRARHGD